MEIKLILCRNKPGKAKWNAQDTRNDGNNCVITVKRVCGHFPSLSAIRVIMSISDL